MESSAPNPFMSAAAQSMANSAAAQEQQRMNMMNQKTPYGSLRYSSDSSSPAGYSATQEFSPEVQRLLDTNIGNSQGMSDAQGGLLRNVNERITQPLDLSYDSNAARIADLQRKTLDPMWSEKRSQFDQTMANRGLVPGSAAYDAASRNFGLERDNAYDRMFLDSYNTASGNKQAEYNSPFNALSALRSGTQIAQPVGSMGLTTTPQESIQPVNISGMMKDSAAANAQSRNAMMGGLFGLGGNILSMAML